MIATDEQLYKLLEDLEGWKQRLPESLRFNGPDTGTSAGMFWSSGSLMTGLGLPVRSIIHALRLCKHDLLACIHADLLHVSRTPQILLDS